MEKVGWIAGVFVTLSLVLETTAGAQSLRGSHASLVRQRQWAVAHDFTFLRTPSDVRRFVRQGILEPLRGNRDYETHAVSFPYARPEVRMFVERLAAQYRSGCGEKLVVTSATRPITRQPHNASRLSTHPAGMAVDLRRSHKSSCRRWLENVLLQLERRGVLEATRERFPPHYHVAVFPKPYARYVAGLGGGGEEAAPTQTASVESGDAGIDRTYQVRRGDSLWSIATENGVSVRLLKRANDMRSTRIHPGQKLVIPSAS